MPIGICKLCLQSKELQESHLYPRGMYKALRDTSQKNQNPECMTSTTSKRVSLHIQDYVLCWDCEQLFSRNGENWVVPRSHTGTTFELREILRNATPIENGCDERLVPYAGREIPGIDMEKLIYFGLSLFWRASVHEWKFLDSVINMPLGDYEEVLRRFLLGGAGLGKDVLLSIFVCPRDEPWRSFSNVGIQWSERGEGSGMILLCGLSFLLKVGNVDPLDIPWSSNHSDRGLIHTSTTLDDASAFFAVSTYLKQSGLDSEYSVEFNV